MSEGERYLSWILLGFGQLQAALMSGFAISGVQDPRHCIHLTGASICHTSCSKQLSMDPQLALHPSGQHLVDLGFLLG